MLTLFLVAIFFALVLIFHPDYKDQKYQLPAMKFPWMTLLYTTLILKLVTTLMRY